MDERKPADRSTPEAVPPRDAATAPVPFDMAATAAVPAPSPMRPATFPYQPGDVILPGYRLTKRLGSGGFGEVWRASAPGGMGVAIKILANLGRKEGGREYRALETIKNIRHAHIVPLFGVWLKANDGRVLAEDELADAERRILAVAPHRGVGLDADLPHESPETSLESLELIVAMGLGDQTLFDRLREVKRGGGQGLPLADLLTWMQQAALALDHFNSGSRRSHDNLKAVQHCDIKPQNMLLVGDAVQVCDFGLARAQGEVRATSNTMASLAYAAPEMVSPPYDPSPTTDQYSLAMTYVELRTGRLPYADASPIAIMRAKVDGRIDLTDLPAAEALVLERALEVDPAKRWPNCIEFVRALRASARQSGLETSGDIVAREADGQANAAPGRSVINATRRPTSDRRAGGPEAQAARPAGRGLRVAAFVGLVAATLVGGYAVIRPWLRPANETGGGAAVQPRQQPSPLAESAAASPRDRAVTLQQRGDFAAAGEAFALVHAAQPNELAAVLWDLQTQAADAGRPADCVPLLERLARLYAGSPQPQVKGITRWDVLNALAWYTATRPEADATAGRKALALANDALELAGDAPQLRAQSLDTLAAAAARAGDWPEAMRRIDEAIALEQDPAQRADFKKHRDGYERQVPWSEP